MLTRIGQRLDRVEGVAQNPDLHGSTLKNVGPASQPTDAARKDQVDTAVTRVTVIGSGSGNLVAGKGISLAEGDNFTQVSIKQQGALLDVSETPTVTDPADSPVTPDALRDDLVAGALADIRAQLAALGVAVNEIHDRLRGAEVVV